MQLGLAKDHHKNHNQRKKWAWLLAREAPKYLGFPLIFSNGRAVLLGLAELLVYISQGSVSTYLRYCGENDDACIRNSLLNP